VGLIFIFFLVISPDRSSTVVLSILANFSSRNIFALSRHQVKRRAPQYSGAPFFIEVQQEYAADRRDRQGDGRYTQTRKKYSTIISE
jgi:hypothetical protein